jgi:hypothetical protein
MWFQGLYELVTVSSSSQDRTRTCTGAPIPPPDYFKPMVGFEPQRPYV